MRLTRRAEGHRYQSFGLYLNDILDNERNKKNTTCIYGIIIYIIFIIIIIFNSFIISFIFS